MGFLHKSAFLWDKCLECIIAALDVDIGHHFFEEVHRANPFENADGTDSFHSGQDAGTVLLSIHRTPGAFNGTDRQVAIDSHQEQISFLACILQVNHVTRVNDIEATIGHRQRTAL